MTKKTFKPVSFFTYPHPDISARNEINCRDWEKRGVLSLLYGADKSKPEVKENLFPANSSGGKQQTSEVQEQLLDMQTRG